MPVVFHFKRLFGFRSVCTNVLQMRGKKKPSCYIRLSLVHLEVLTGITTTSELACYHSNLFSIFVKLCAKFRGMIFHGRATNDRSEAGEDHVSNCQQSSRRIHAVAMEIKNWSSPLDVGVF